MRYENREGFDVSGEWVDFMRFTLEYSGPLRSAGSGKSRPENKHAIRKALHPQLRRLWQTDLSLRDWSFRKKIDFGVYEDRLWVEELAEQFTRLSYRFVPLVNDFLCLNCELNIALLLPPENLEDNQNKPDIDNRLKIIFDALRMPDSKAELGPYESPDETEDPFFVLLQDDKLIDAVNVKREPLLDPDAEGLDQHNHCRMLIEVNVTRFQSTLYNDPFS